MSNGIHNNDTSDPQYPLERVSEMVIKKIIKKNLQAITIVLTF